MTNPVSDFWFEGLRGPGETWTEFGFPKNNFLRLHAYVSRVKLPENDKSGFRFGVERLRRPGETRRDFGLPKNHCFRLHAYGSIVKLPENDESGFRFWGGGTRRDVWFSKTIF
jgi:hypothetical protein